MVDIHQTFNWHDIHGNQDYVVGEDGYLKMDASRTPVQCHRQLKEKITNRSGSLELAMRVVLDEPEYHTLYTLRLYDSADRPAIVCHIRRDGRLLFQGRNELMDSGRVLTFQGNCPFNDRTRRKWYVVESDEHAYTFEAFDFANQTAVFLLDGRQPVTVPFRNPVRDIAKLELRTGGVGIGRYIRVKHMKQFVGGEQIDREDHPLCWKPVPPPRDGEPDDNVCESRLRPVENRWLEVITRYGFVTTTFPVIPKGTLEFDVKSPDVSAEACILLGECDGSIKCFRKIQTGILTNRMTIATGHPEPGFNTFDNSVAPENDRAYRFRIAWDAETNKQRIWIDDVPQIYLGETEIEIHGLWGRDNRMTRGIDTISLHPGLLGTARLTSIQKAEGRTLENPPEPLRTWWGSFRLRALV